MYFCSLAFNSQADCLCLFHSALFYMKFAAQSILGTLREAVMTRNKI